MPEGEGIARRINNAGQVLGEEYDKVGGHMHVFLYGGHIQTLRDLPGVDAYLNANHIVRVDVEDGGISDSGQITLGLEQTLGYSRAYVYGDGRFQYLGLLPGGHTSQAQTINNLGQVVGAADTSNGEHACLWKDGSMTDLGTLPGFVNSDASPVNDKGQVVGVLTHSHDVRHDFSCATNLLV